MRSVDVRSRCARDVRVVDSVAFFGDELPQLLVDRDDLAAPGARELDLRATAVRLT